MEQGGTGRKRDERLGRWALWIGAVVMFVLAMVDAVGGDRRRGVAEIALAVSFGVTASGLTRRNVPARVFAVLLALGAVALLVVGWIG